jgi:hypothetical protein
MAVVTTVAARARSGEGFDSSVACVAEADVLNIIIVRHRCREGLLVAVPTNPCCSVDVAKRKHVRRLGQRRQYAVTHLRLGRHPVFGRYLAEPLDQRALGIAVVPFRSGEIANPLVVEPSPPIALPEYVADVDLAPDQRADVLPRIIGVAVLLPAASIVATGQSSGSR